MVFQFVEYSGLVHLFLPAISKGSKQACIVEFFLGASGAILEILHQWNISLDLFFTWKLRFQVICTFFASLTLSLSPRAGTWDAFLPALSLLPCSRGCKLNCKGMMQCPVLKSLGSSSQHHALECCLESLKKFSKTLKISKVLWKAFPLCRKPPLPNYLA